MLMGLRNVSGMMCVDIYYRQRDMCFMYNTIFLLGGNFKRKFVNRNFFFIHVKNDLILCNYFLNYEICTKIV